MDFPNQACAMLQVLQLNDNLILIHGPPLIRIFHQKVNQTILNGLIILKLGCHHSAMEALNYIFRII
jgi:hypothetical protein